MKLLFVCLGNICRSPLAEGIMLHLNESLQLNWEIDSAGTSNYHVGEAPDDRTIRNAATHGIDLKPLRARQFSEYDFEHFDFIFVMDKNNYENIVQLSNVQSHKDKVQLFLNAAEVTSSEEVPDPYYGSEADFENVFQLVWKASDALVKKLQSAFN